MGNCARSLPSKIRAAYLASLVPASAGGPCKAVASDTLALLTALRVDRAHHNAAPVGGVTLDIQKCYNAVHRGSLLQLLRILGIPKGVIDAFRGMMEQMRRLFQVGGCCSEQCRTTGLVEGCGFAVPAMQAFEHYGLQDRYHGLPSNNLHLLC